MSDKDHVMVLRLAINVLSLRPLCKGAYSKIDSGEDTTCSDCSKVVNISSKAAIALGLGTK